MRDRHRIGCLMLCAMLMLHPVPASAQSPNRPRAPFRESVSLQTSNAVTKKLGIAREYLNNRKWDEAVEVITELADTAGDSLTPVSAGRYVNVRVYCNLLLAGLPPEGLAVYRSRVDPQVENRLQAARRSRDPRLLKRILRKGFASSYGDEALFLLGQWAWERGDLARAREYWEGMLPLSAETRPGRPLPVLRFPDTDFDRPSILARLILCDLFLGDRRRAGRELDVLREEFPQARGQLAGRKGNLVGILESVITESGAWSRPAQSASVRTFGGNARRNTAVPEAVDVGGPRWSVPLPEDQWTSAGEESSARRREPLSYHPVVSGERVFLNDALRIYAWNLETGKPAWPANPDTSSGADPTEAVIYPPVPDHRDPPPSRTGIGVPHYTLTLHGGRLYARMGPPVTGRSEGERRHLTSDLVCLDVAGGQGKLLWTVSADALALDGRGWAFDGSPVVDSGRVYVPVRRIHPQTQLQVACLDAETGRLVWSQEVCTAVTRIPEKYNLVGHHVLTLADGTLFYSTDTGAIAALDAETGLLRWVVTYESRVPEDPEVMGDPAERGLKPPVYHRGTVFASPNDTDAVMAIDAGTGLLKWQRELPDRIRHILGVGAGRLIVSGDSLWGLEVETGRRVWGAPVHDPEFFGHGRGVLVGETVWWPTRETIEIRSQRTGQPVMRQPINLRMKGAGGGNLAIAGDALIAAGADRLIVFSETGRAAESPVPTLPRLTERRNIRTITSGRTGRR